jgi:hydroxyacylglutathione hydrolase
MPLIHDGPVLVHKIAGMGPYDNNGYILADPSTREAYLVDAPEGVGRLIDEAQDFDVKGVVITHTHPDHIAGLGMVRERTGLPVWVHEADAHRLPAAPDGLLVHGGSLTVGTQRIHLLHTPGHTPGGTCLRAEGVLIAGDTLFPGGPGRTGSPGDFKRLVVSITERLLTLPDGTVVCPGHGADTTIGTSRAEYAAFAAREHPADLHGHVAWLTS